MNTSPAPGGPQRHEDGSPLPRGGVAPALLRLPTAVPVFLVDPDCGFCLASMRWAQRWVRPRARFVPFPAADVANVGLSLQQCARLARLVLPDGRVRTGSAAVAGVLATGPGWARVAAAVIDAPGIRRLAQAVYAGVSRNRHRLPGGTATCALP